MLALIGMFIGGARAADEKKPTPKAEPPRILLALPLGLIAGETNVLQVRGLNLTNITEAKIVSTAGTLPVTIRSRSTANNIDGFDAQRVGDQKLELEVLLGAEQPSGTNTTLVLQSEAGPSLPFHVLVAQPSSIVSEKEPNNAFRDASVALSGMIIRGAIDSAGDVDVFQMEVEPGQHLRAEVFAERLGSTLDAALSVYDHAGNLLGNSDDSVGRDPRLDLDIQKLETVRVVVSSVNEKAAATHAYLLKIEWGKRSP
jgi:hypothetical protein